MNVFNRNLNAIVAIAAREVMNFVRTPGKIIFVFIFPVIFMGIMGGSLEQNVGSEVGFNFMQFILFGMIVGTLYQTSFTSVTSLIEDRENDFTQEIFVAPISRFAMILGKIFGGTIISLLSLIGLFVIAIFMQIPLTAADVERSLLMWPIICISGGVLGILFISLVNDAQTADMGAFVMIFPQMFLAGVLTPVNNSTGILGLLTHLMPMTYLVDLMRNLIYAGRPEADQLILYSPTLDLAVIAAIVLVFLVVGTIIFTRSSRAR